VPPEIRARFPNLVPDVPRSFPRLVQGRVPMLRIGWGVIRPRSLNPEAPPTPIVQPPVQLQPQSQPQPQTQPQQQSPQQQQQQPRQQQPRRPPPIQR
jgi:hypothetical protein